MRLNLSSQISLGEIPKNHYQPTNDFDKYALTRLEYIPTDIYDSVDAAAEQVAVDIANSINAKESANETFVLAVSGGTSLLPVYDKLIHKYEAGIVSFEKVKIVLLTEFFPARNIGNYSLLKESFLNHIDVLPENVFYPNVHVEKEKVSESCKEFSAILKKLGTIDYLLMGVGRKGGIVYNLPGVKLYAETRLIMLDKEARQDALSAYGKLENVPSSAITVGLSTILSAKKITLVAWGETKAKVIKEIVEDKISDKCPASYLQSHSNISIVTDLPGGSALTRINRPWLVTDCEWNDKLTCQAIVWLCQKLDKPILKLTNNDYNENGLGQLLTAYKSAYDVNIKVFNHLQHTISGWPGGKPNADDSFRPERAKPFPKRAIIFSPHPDDDVISMGGTFQRLVNQGHDVHVAYETSGNIAVGDDELFRYVSFMEDVQEIYFPKNRKENDLFEKVKKQILEKKGTEVQETPDTLFLKGRIRREEASSACRYIGLPKEKIHFLDLPFYETGQIMKKPLSEKDVLIVKKLIEDIKPHQMYVAGDLADPHGTHKVALNAVLAAVDLLKDEEWMKDCRIWMYRGAWMEWEIENIEMAIPLSPEELRQKRNAILKHQSQMESAPFLGDDERLFWQRSEDRNRNTALLYQQLGLASYEAIEAFVQYKIIK